MKTRPLSRVHSATGLARAALLCLLLALWSSRPVRGGGLPVDPAIAPYVTYLQEHGEDPVEFVLRLFESHDVVILTERDHRETTQYDFIYTLISDPRFIARVGTIFTECGSVSRQGDLDAYLASDPADDRAALALLRNLNFFALGWPYRNLFDFLKRFHDLNRSLDAAHKIRWYFDDVPWRWDGLTAAEYRTGFDSVANCRDEIMAAQVRSRMAAMEKSAAPRKKALIIMNTRHGFKVPQEMNGRIYAEDFASCLNRMEPTAGKVASVMFNYTSREQAPIQDGKWDAAFAVLGNAPRAVRFDDGSPFGRDRFDYGQLPPTFTYGEVFDGMIFYQPLEAQRICDDIPGLYARSARARMLQRAQVEGDLAWARAELADRDAHPEKYRLRPAYPASLAAAVAKWLKKGQVRRPGGP